MAELTKKEHQPKDADGNVLPVPATPEAVAADAAAAAPKQDELQKRRERVADAGLAHGSMNNHVPLSKDEFSEAERKGDTARQFPDNVSEQTRRANAENNEQVGASTDVGKPAVGSDPLRDPGVDSSATAGLPEGEEKPSDTVQGSGDGSDAQGGSQSSQGGSQSGGQSSGNNEEESGEAPVKSLSKQNRTELEATAKEAGVTDTKQYKTNADLVKAIKAARRSARRG